LRAYALLFIFFIAISGWQPDGCAYAGAGTTLRSEPLVFELAVGEEKTLDIVLEDVNQIYAADIRLSFNQSAVNIVDANLSRPGVQLIPGTIPQPDLPILNSADNSLGTLRYAVTQMNPSEPMDGSGTVFSIKLRGVGIGESALFITSVTLSDIDGKPLDVLLLNGLIRVKPKSGDSLIYLPLVRR